MVRPYRFDDIKKLSKQQLTLEEGVSQYVSARPFKEDFCTALGQTIGQYLKSPCTITVNAMQVVTAAEVPTLVPKIGCIMVLGLSPQEQKLLVELDGDLAVFIIERLLGGAGDQGRLIRPLTDIEEGILSFIILKVISEVQSGREGGEQLTLTLDRFAYNVTDIAPHIEAAQWYYSVGCTVAFDKRTGYVRILMPHALAVPVMGPPAQSGEADQDTLRRRLRAIGDIPVEARVEIAQVRLDAADLASLEVGDIIVLDEHQITKTEAGFEGEVIVKLGKGENGGFAGRLINSEAHSKLHIAEIIQQEHPPEE